MPKWSVGHEPWLWGIFTRTPLFLLVSSQAFMSLTCNEMQKWSVRHEPLLLPLLPLRLNKHVNIIRSVVDKPECGQAFWVLADHGGNGAGR